MLMKLDYKKLGFKCGLEIHQELDTGKLFCSCSSALAEKDECSQIRRKLRPVAGETGNVDVTALFESARKRHFIYHAYKDEACLVEMDAEPPHPINEEAKKTALLFASLLKMNIPKEIHVMRKTVTDGSATSGFQRTALIGLSNQESFLDTSNGRVYLESMSLEEDASKIIEKKDDEIHYSLSRLGIPLIELTTAPDIKDPGHAKETASKIGMLLRSFPQMKRGIGTIRQDVNISIFDGARTEIKGWQDLSRLSLLVENEVKRHMFMNSLKSELEKKGIKKISTKPEDVTDLFIKTKSKLISSLISRNAIVLALKLPGFAGILGREVCPKKTFGKELSEYAKAFGAKGMLHTDEDLSKYSIVHEFSLVRKKLQAKDDDLVLIIAETKTTAENAINSVFDRARQCLVGLPEETRVPNHADATSSYARPLSGAHRMYPETDIATINVSAGYLASIVKDMPETLETKKERFEQKLGLNSELSSAIISSGHLPVFEKITAANKNILPKDIANFFVNTLADLKKRDKIDVSKIHDSGFEDLFRNLAKGNMLKDTIPQFLKIKAGHPELFADEIIKNYSLAPLSEKDARKIIDRIVSKNPKAPKGAMIGMAMSELKGRFDGKKIAVLVGNMVEKK